ncbi:MAG: hypothetical protein KAR19_03815 [Bacteroidales bacterium]|nr:hypothetical protein [Bacteroidales bacterium]
MKNIRFVINGSAVDMGNGSMSFQYNNPMFGDVGSHSLPIPVPRNKKNDAVLNTFHPGSIAPTKRFPAQLFIGALPFQGEFVLSSITEKYYEGHFTTGNSTFRDLVTDVKLSDIDYTEEIAGSSTVSFTVALEAAARSSHPTYNYTCFPMLAPNYYDGNPFAYSLIINPWGYHNVPGLEGFIAYNGRDLGLIYAPSFYLCFVIQKIFDTYGYTIESNDIYDDTEMRTLVIPNFNTLGIVDSTYLQYDLKFADALPPIGINDFITNLEKMLNLTFFVSEKGKTVNIKKNTSIIKSLPEKRLRLLSRELQPEEHDGFVLNYIMDPDDSHAQITPIDDYELGITVDNKEDLSSYAASNYPNKLAKISNNDLYYLSKLSDAATDTWTWEVLTKDFFKYSEGGKGLEIITEANPILTDNDNLYTYLTSPLYPAHALFPRVEKSSMSSDGSQEYKTFSSLRLLFYRGIVDSGGLITNPGYQVGQYPLASPDVYRPQGLTSPNRYGRTKITSANMSLRWGGTYGLYETNWKDYLYWFQNIKRPAKDYYDMSLQEFISIDFWKKYQAGDLSFLFRSINLEVDFARDTCRIGECEVYLS